MNFIKKLTILLSIGVITFSCENDDTLEVVKPEDPSELPEIKEPIEVTDPKDPEDPNKPTPIETEIIDPTVSTSLTNELDRMFFEQLKGFGDIYDTKKNISDYNFLNYPMYFIFKNEDGNVEKGFVINPISTIENAVKLGENENFGLNIYRYDKQMNDGLEELNGADGNGLYGFDFTIKGENNYYLQTYEKKGVKGLNGLNDITTAAHEAFHDHYQTTKASTNSKWNFSFNLIQDEKNFPITKELLELQLLNTEILKEFPNITDVSLIREKMKQYVSIKSEELELDPTSNKLILNTELEQERLEGAPHYVEILARREFSLLNANDPNYESFGFSTLDSDESFFTPIKGHLPFTYKIESRSSLQRVMGFDVAYPMGASVIYAINKLNKEKVQLINSQTPYRIISEMLNLSDSEKSRALVKAKASVDWKKIQDRATQLLNLR